MNVLVTAGSRRVPLVQAFQAVLRAEGPGRVIVTDVDPSSPAVHVAHRSFRVPLATDDGYVDALLEICAAERIRQAYNGRLPFEFREDEVTIVEVDIEARPKILVDHREVVWAGFKSPEQLAGLPIVPHVRDYLAARPGP